MPQEEETARPALLTKVQESLLGYWDVAKAAAQKLYKKTYLPAMDEKIRYHPPPTPTPGTGTPGPQSLLPQTQESRFKPGPGISRPRYLSSQPPVPVEPRILRCQPCPT